MGGTAPVKNIALDNFIQLKPNETQAEALVLRRVIRPCKSYKTLPTTVAELKTLLLDLKAKGLIVFGKQQIKEYLQGLIDTSQSDTHLLFGTWHKDPGQYTYIHELLFGSQDQALSSITHIVLEIFGQGNVDYKAAEDFAKKYQSYCDKSCKAEADKYKRGDLQYFIDLYQRYQSQGALKVLDLYGRTFFKKDFPIETFENSLRIITSNIINANKYQILASDISDSTERLLKENLSEFFVLYELREYFATSYALQKQDPSKKDVFAYIWGADHIDKYGIPKFIPETDNVISIGLSGGGPQNPKTLLEQAIKELGWSNQELLVIFNGKGQPSYQEFDLLLFLPLTPGPETTLLPEANPYNIYTRPMVCPITK